MNVDIQLERSANEYFWDNVLSSLDSPHDSESTVDQNITPSKQTPNSIPNIGIVIDLVQDSSLKDDYLKLLRRIEPLGINLIQLNLANDFGQAVEYKSIPNIGYFQASLEHNETDKKAKSSFYNLQRLGDMVHLAHENGIRLIPEINLATNGGGWYNTGVLMDCPQTLCDKGHNIAFDVIDKMESVIPIVVAAILEIWDAFSISPFQSFLHLGADERKAAIDGCFMEAGHEASTAKSAYNRFEKTLLASLSMVGIDPNQIIRWHNREKVKYPDRVGYITHYTEIDDVPKVPESGILHAPFFGTVLLEDDTTPWDVYRDTRRWLNGPSTPQGMVIKTIGGQIPQYDHLVAFAMGLGLTAENKGSLTTSDSFHGDFELECVRFECENAMAPFGDFTGGRIKIQNESSTESCTDRTVNITLRKSRKFL